MTTIKELVQRIGERTDSTSLVATEKDEPHPFVAAHPWRFELYRPIHSVMLEEAIRFASAVLNGDEPRWLSFLGPSGVGKTFLMMQVLTVLQHAASTTKEHGTLEDTFYQRKVWSIKTPTGARWPSLGIVRASRDLDDYKAAKEFAENFDLVFIEDLAAIRDIEKGSGAVTRARLAELLQLRTNRWTLLDANLSIAEIEEVFDGRIASRLQRDTSVCVQIPDDVPDYSDR